jgi:hypothetical protein
MKKMSYFSTFRAAGGGEGGGDNGWISFMKHDLVYTVDHSDYRTVSHYWVLLVYVALIRQFGQMMGTGHYYFDEMRSSFNLVQNQLFALPWELHRQPYLCWDLLKLQGIIFFKFIPMQYFVVKN